MNRLSRLVVIGSIAVVLAAAAASCSGPGGGASICERAVQHASDHTNETDFEDVDGAIRACTTVAELRAAATKYPAAFDGIDPVEFVRTRCQSGGPTDAALCSLVQ